MRETYILMVIACMNGDGIQHEKQSGNIIRIFDGRQ